MADYGRRWINVFIWRNSLNETNLGIIKMMADYNNNNTL